MRRWLLALFLLFGAAGAFGAAWLLQLDAWHELDMSKILDVQKSLILYDAEGEEITTLHTQEDRIWISIKEIPLMVRYAFIAAEDARFYDHFGVDIIRIFGAAWADLKAGEYVQGASTISQQLIKLTHLTDEKVMERKIDEAVLAYQLEKRYDKDEILEMYLNYVYFGGGYYGIEAAARGYFGVHASELTVAQAAQLAGILKSPSRYAPHLNMEASIGRRNLVLSLMKEYGYLDETACAEAMAEPVALRHGQNQEKRGYYVDLVLTESCELLGVEMDELLSGGYRIYTAMDSDLQAACERLFADDANFPAAGVEGVEGALVVVDVRTGGVAALTTLEFEPGLVGHDLKAALDVFSPYRDEKGRVIHYQHHDTWHDDNGSSHIKALLLSPFITVPIVAGRMTLGPWQNLTLVECDTRDRVRDIVFQVMGE